MDDRAVDISGTLDRKLACLRSCRTMILHMIKDLNASMAERNMRLPALVGDEQAAIDEYTRLVIDKRDAAVGARHGLRYAEEFHYIGPDHALDDYIAGHAVPA